MSPEGWSYGWPSSLAASYPEPTPWSADFSASPFIDRLDVADARTPDLLVFDVYALPLDLFGVRFDHSLDDLRPVSSNRPENRNKGPQRYQTTRSKWTAVGYILCL